MKIEFIFYLFNTMYWECNEICDPNPTSNFYDNTVAI